MRKLIQEGNELKWENVYCLGNREYDKITVTTSPKDILTSLMKIPKPWADEPPIFLTHETWLDIQYAIKLIMDAYGIHLNQAKGLIMHDDSKGSTLKELEKLEEKFWWLDKYKTEWNSDTHQTETIKNN